jgi:hypothetical protein
MINKNDIRCRIVYNSSPKITKISNQLVMQILLITKISNQLVMQILLITKISNQLVMQILLINEHVSK